MRRIGTAMKYDFVVMVKLYLQRLLISDTKRNRSFIFKAW